MTSLYIPQEVIWVMDSNGRDVHGNKAHTSLVSQPDHECEATLTVTGSLWLGADLQYTKL